MFTPGQRCQASPVSDLWIKGASGVHASAGKALRAFQHDGRALCPAFFQPNRASHSCGMAQAMALIGSGAVCERDQQQLSGWYKKE